MGKLTEYMFFLKKPPQDKRTFFYSYINPNDPYLKRLKKILRLWRPNYIPPLEHMEELYNLWILNDPDAPF